MTYIHNQLTFNKKSFEYLKTVDELKRMLICGGKLLITVPFGKYETHGFFQQFDTEMIGRLSDSLKEKGSISFKFFKYLKSVWILSNQQDCEQQESYNLHTGKGKKDDRAAHSRSIFCIEFIKPQ